MKAQLSLHSLLVLVACFAYFTANMTFLHVGTKSLSLWLQPKLEAASSELSMYQKSMQQEDKFVLQLDKLIGHELGIRLFEIYPDCLTRGLDYASSYIPPAAFHYAETRRQVMDWTITNCQRIFYTPQPFEPTMREVIVAHIHKGKKHVQQAFYDGLKYIKSQARVVWEWYSGQPRSIPRMTAKITPASKEFLNDEVPLIRANLLPAATGVTFEDLLWYQLLGASILEDTTLEKRFEAFADNLAKLQRCVADIDEVLVEFTYLSQVFHRMALWGTCLNLLCGLIYITAKSYVTINLENYQMSRQTTGQFQYRTQRDQFRLAACTCLFGLSKVCAWALNSNVLDSSVVANYLWHITSSIGLLMLVNLFVTSNHIYSIFDIFSTVRDLFSILSSPVLSNVTVSLQQTPEEVIQLEEEKLSDQEHYWADSEVQSSELSFDSDWDDNNVIDSDHETISNPPK